MTIIPVYCQWICQPFLLRHNFYQCVSQLCPTHCLINQNFFCWLVSATSHGFFPSDVVSHNSAIVVYSHRGKGKFKMENFFRSIKKLCETVHCLESTGIQNVCWAPNFIGVLKELKVLHWLNNKDALLISGRYSTHQYDVGTGHLKNEKHYKYMVLIQYQRCTSKGLRYT